MLSIRPTFMLIITYGVCIRRMCNYAEVLDLLGGESVINRATLQVKTKFPILLKDL